MKNILFILIFSISLIFIGCSNKSVRKEIDLTPENDFGIKITNILDKTKSSDKLISGLGYTCIIETNNKTILLDTGDYGDSDPGNIVVSNMKKLGFKPKDIDIVFISHWHKGKGLEYIYSLNPNLIIYAPLEDYQTKDYKYKNINYNIVDDNWLEIIPNIYSSRSMNHKYDSRYEQSLIINTEEGLIVNVSCAHPGILELLERVRDKFPQQNILLLMGGFHLSDLDTNKLNQILARIIELEVEMISPTHCSGTAFQELAKEKYTTNYIENFAGLTINF